MLTQVKYLQRMKNIGIKSIVYNDYSSYEQLWLDYFNGMFLPGIQAPFGCCVRVIFCESCPDPGNGVHPHPHYIFNTPNNNVLIYPNDKYLHQIYKGICQPNNTIINVTRQQALIDLIKHPDGPVLIMDLLPSHGVKLTPANRRSVNANPSGTLDLMKISDAFKAIQTKSQCKPLIVKAVFATPPTINTKIISNAILGVLPTNVSMTFFHPTINAGQGHAPSWRALQAMVNGGFRCP